jgi:hypothetical protein
MNRFVLDSFLFDYQLKAAAAHVGVPEFQP